MHNSFLYWYTRFACSALHNCALSWYFEKSYAMMHGQKNIKLSNDFCDRKVPRQFCVQRSVRVHFETRETLVWPCWVTHRDQRWTGLKAVQRIMKSGCFVVLQVLLQKKYIYIFSILLRWTAMPDWLTVDQWWANFFRSGPKKKFFGGP